MHIATHGYFITDHKSDTQIKENEYVVFKISDHPMLRLGLIFSGCNAYWRCERSLAGGDFGVLTDCEIRQLNLSNTD